jgi:hypothetical protein
VTKSCPLPSSLKVDVVDVELVVRRGMNIVQHLALHHLLGVELCHLRVEDVEAVASPDHLGQEALSLIPDTKHSAVDLHMRPILIQLPEADDGVPQRRDVHR